MEERTIDEKIVSARKEKMHGLEATLGTSLAISSQIFYWMGNNSQLHFITTAVGLITGIDGISRSRTGYGLLHHLTEAPTYLSRYFHRANKKEGKY